MLVCALLLTISLGWALYDEALGQRPWKGIQKQFVTRYTRYLKSIKPQAGNTEKEVKESSEYQALEAEAQAALEHAKPEVAEIDQKVAQVQQQLDAVTVGFHRDVHRRSVGRGRLGRRGGLGAVGPEHRDESERGHPDEVEVEPVRRGQLESHDHRCPERRQLAGVPPAVMRRRRPADGGNGAGPAPPPPGRT